MEARRDRRINRTEREHKIMAELTIPAGATEAEFSVLTWVKTTDTAILELCKTVLELHQRIKALEAR